MNSFIKKILFISCLAASQIVLSAEMTPLSTVVKNNDLKKDHAMASYLVKRCSAISSVIGGVMIEKMGEQEKGKNFQKDAAEYAAVATQIDKSLQNKRNPNSRKTDQEWNESTYSVIKDLMMLYFDGIKKNSALTGNYFSDSFKSDIDICNNLNKYVK